MQLTNTVASKALVAFVAAAMVFSAFAMPAKAATVEEMQKMINDLMAQIAKMQGGSTTTSSAAVCPYTWTRDMRIGATGADVMKLQQFLNANADTRVAATGAGSAGMETQTFGPATAAAVSKFQVMHRADILTPAGLTNPTGFFGPSTRAKANALCVASSSTDEDEDEDEDDTDSAELSGEASLDLFEMEDGAEDEAEEGESDVVVGELSVEFTDGDASISRIDVTVEGGVGGNGKAYDAFETISLWVDGDMVAEVEASDEDAYLDEDDGTIRFSGLDIVAMEDEELNIDVAVSVQNNVDSSEIGSWTITPNAVRYFDAEDVASTETDAGSVVEGNAEFDVVVEGDDEALDVSLSSDSPDSSNVAVDSDSDTNDVKVMAMTLEAENNDVELNTVVVRVRTNATTTTNVVDEAKLVIDGQTFRAEAINDTAANTGANLFALGRSASNGADAVWYLFDIDGDVMIDEDSELTAEVVLDLNDTNDGANYATGQQIFAEVTSTELNAWDVEGANDINPDGGAVGETHTLVDEGLTFDVVDISAIRTAGTGNTPVDSAEFEVEVEITAIGDTFYIEDDSNTAFDFIVQRNGTNVTDANGAATGTGISATLGGSGVSKSGNRYRIDEGQSETFTFKVTVLPGGDPAAKFRVQFDDVDFFTVSSGGTAQSQTFIPSEDFRTNEVTIVN